MFRSDQQRGMVCAILTARLPCGPYWRADERGDRRPTGTVAAHLKHCYAASEVHLARLAWSIWNGNGRFSLDGALNVFDGSNLRMLGSLLFAIGGSTSSAVDAWIADYRDRLEEPEREARPS